MSSCSFARQFSERPDYADNGYRDGCTTPKRESEAVLQLPRNHIHYNEAAHQAQIVPKTLGNLKPVAHKNHHNRRHGNRPQDYNPY